MTKIDRRTYCNTIISDRKEYEKIHGIIESYGGRVKDVDYNWQTGEMILFYEMGKDQREEFEKELYNN